MTTLQNLTVVEFETVGGVPFCAWLLAQHGANIVRITNPKRPELGVPVSPDADLGTWRREELPLNLKSPDDVKIALEHIQKADVLIEGFRPGVMERLGLGPAHCHAENPALVYARLVGWDRQGPWATRAGHDINYMSMSGVLHAMGSDALPLNLIADIGGGALYTAFGILAALQARTQTRRGSIVDMAMTAGSAHLMTNQFARLAAGAWIDAPRSNVLDGGTPWYRNYKTSDGRHMAVGAIEHRFYETFITGLGLDPTQLPDRSDPNNWPVLTERFSSRFQTASLEHWASLFATLEACVTPILSMHEVQAHPVTQDSFHKEGTVTIPNTVPHITPI